MAKKSKQVPRVEVNDNQEAIRIAEEAILVNSQIKTMGKTLNSLKTRLRNFASSVSPERILVDVITELGTVKVSFQDLKASITSANKKKLPALREAAGDETFLSVFAEKVSYVPRDAQSLEDLRQEIGEDKFFRIFERQVSYDIRGTAHDYKNVHALMSREQQAMFDELINVGYADPAVTIPTIKLEEESDMEAEG